MPSSWRRLLGAPRSLDISRFAGSLGAVGGTAAGRRRGPTRSVRRMMADVPRPVGRHRLRWASRLAAPALTRQGYPRRGAAGSRPPPTALRGTNRTPPAVAHNQDPGRGAEPGGADRRDEGHLLPRSSRAAGLVSSRDTRHLLRARLSRGLIRVAPVAGHPSRCDGTAEPSARWLGPRETPSAAVRGRGVPAPDRRESGRGLLRTFPRRLSLASGGEGRGKAGCLASSWTTERKENPP